MICRSNFVRRLCTIGQSLLDLPALLSWVPLSRIPCPPFLPCTKQLRCSFFFLSVFFHAGALSLAAAGNSENSVASGLGSSLGASLERPGTSLRGGGRVAMTVLRPQQQKPATALPQLAMPQPGQEAQAGPERSPRRSLLGVKNVSKGVYTLIPLTMCPFCL